jgi:hypothetical protein
MFGFKKRKIPIHRDEATKVFMRHCGYEADKLLATITPVLRDFCDGKNGRPSFENVMSQQLLSFQDGQFKVASSGRSLIAAHCYAITIAIGLDALHRNIDPPSQSGAMEWNIYRSIIEEDVGPDNVGRPPSPWIEPPATSDVLSMHIQYAPGTFVNGAPSLQKKLSDRYTRLFVSQKVVVLLMALRIFRPRRGVSKALYQRTDFQGGVVGLNRIGAKPPDLNDLDEWEDDLQISDTGDALIGFPPDVLAPLISALSAVDPFWPTFGKSHHVTWAIVEGD